MKIRKNGKVITLTEGDLQRIVKRVIMEGKSPDGSTIITKLVITPNRMGSSVTLSDGETYNYSEGDNYELPSMGYSNWCKPGEYTGNQLPQNCSVSIDISDSESYECDSKGCRKRRHREK
jgi:hypothetical protein